MKIFVYIYIYIWNIYIYDCRNYVGQIAMNERDRKKINRGKKNIKNRHFS